MQNHNVAGEATTNNNNLGSMSEQHKNPLDIGNGGIGLTTDGDALNKDLAKMSIEETTQQQSHEPHDGNQQLQNHNSDDDDYVLIQPAKIWTRPDIEDFKAEVSAGDGDGVITIGHGDTVTVCC